MCCCFPTLTRYPMYYAGCGPMPMPMSTPMFYGGCGPMPMPMYNSCCFNENYFKGMAGFGIAVGVAGIAGMLINKYC